MLFLKIDKNKIIINLKIKPNYSKNCIIGVIVLDNKHYLQVGIIKPALDGKANLELILFLSKTFDVAKSELRIIKGETSSYKQVQTTIENFKNIKNIWNKINDHYKL